MRGLGIACLLLAASCSACEGEPLPPEQMKYVGLWVAEDRYISIFAEGRLEYKKKLKLGMHNRVQSSFTIEGDVIAAMLSSWVITREPGTVDGTLSMELDGITYHHRGPPRVYGQSNNWPEGIE